MKKKFYKPITTVTDLQMISLIMTGSGTPAPAPGVTGARKGYGDGNGNGTGEPLIW